MNVVIVSRWDLKGGAAKATYRLFKALREFNPQIWMLVREKFSDDPGVIPVVNSSREFAEEEKRFHALQASELRQKRTPISNTLFSLPYPGIDLSQTEIIRKADIVNLHSVTNFQSVETIAALLKSGKQVVWTLHDQNSFTGGCHYAAGCRNYLTDCRDCIQLHKESRGLPYDILQNKIRNWKGKLTIVTPSQWLSTCARESRVLQGAEVYTIPNAVETDIFGSTIKADARDRLSLEKDTVLILFGAHGTQVKRKGYGNFVNALRICKSNKSFKKLEAIGKLKIGIFGAGNDDLSALEMPFVSFGQIDSDRKLAEIYAAADFYVLPSLEDNLPNTMLEAMACGTPLVAFRTGGVPDVVRDGENGLLVPVGDDLALATAIIRMVDERDKCQQLGQNSAALIGREYALENQGKAYLERFKSFLSDDWQMRREERFAGQLQLPCRSGVIDHKFYTSQKQILTKYGMERMAFWAKLKERFDILVNL